MTHHLTFRASPVLMARIEELAEARGSSRSAAIKQAIVEATMPERALTIPDQGEVLELLSRAARGGSVPAMRELLRWHRERRRPRAEGHPLDQLDELARRRGDRR